MNWKMPFALLISVSVLLSLVAGCANNRAFILNAGKLGSPDKIEAYISAFDSYDVFYFHHVGPTAVVFDPKSDAAALRLEGDWWDRVESLDRLRTLVKTMREGYGTSEYVKAIVLQDIPDRKIVAGFIYSPGIIRVAEDPTSPTTAIVRPVYREDACEGARGKVILGGPGLCDDILRGDNDPGPVIVVP